MNRDQLSHVLRAACEIASDPEMLVIGSQSILATYDELRLPPEATSSMEVDVAFSNDPDEAKADRVDGAIGELSMFHERFGYYAQGVSMTTAILPDGWQERVVRWASHSTGEANATFLDRHDLVIAKLVAMREKDTRFATALVKAGLVDVSQLLERVDELPESVDPRAVERIRRWLARLQ